MKKIYALIATVGLVASLGTGAGAQTLQAASQEIDLTKPAGYSLAACTTKAQLDCIESVGVITKRNGKSRVQLGRQTSFQADDSYSDDMGNTYFGGASTWRVKTPTGNKSLDVYAILRTPEFINSFEGDTKNASLQVSMNSPEGGLDLPIQVRVRTSWLNPISMYGSAADATWGSKKIKGGKLWTLRASFSKSYFYSDNVTENFAQQAPADMEFEMWYFSFSNADAGNFGSYKPECASRGLVGYSSNSYGGGPPYWNGSDNSMNSFISGAAFDKEGNAVKGKIKIQFTKSFVACQWPESKFKKAKAFRATLVDAQGNNVPAKIQIRTNKDTVTVTASNFAHGEEQYLKIRAAKK
jgi:hypothetical protein